MLKNSFILYLFIGLFWADISSARQPDYSLSYADLVDTLIPAVVNISTTVKSPSDYETQEIISNNKYIKDYFSQSDGGNTSLGSGFLIDAKGYIITNEHVINNSDVIIVKLFDDTTYEAELIGSDKMTDLALIKITDNKPFPFVKIGDSDKLRVGDKILAIGNPFGLGSSVTSGIVSAKSRDIDVGFYDNFIQTDASINQGSSGGPMFNLKGEVVGINTALFSPTGASMGIGFATPVNLSKFVVTELMSKGKVERGWLGLKVSNSKTEIIISNNKSFNQGVVINSLVPNSPAVNSDLEVGDVIISLNGKEIQNSKEFSRAVAEMTIGKNVVLRKWHAGKIQDINLKIAQMPDITAKADNLNKAAKTSEDIPEGYIETLGIIVENQDNKLLVTEVSVDSDAFAKGLKVGDIIQKAFNTPVSSVELLKTNATLNSKEDMPLQILRDGIPQTLTIKVIKNDQN